MKSIVIEGNLRSDLGKKAAKAVRRDGNVPCVIYGGSENQHFTAPRLAFRDLIYTRDFYLADVKLNGASVQCIVKSVDFHPVTDELWHIDFLELVPGKAFKVELPVRFKGVAPGVKSGGSLIQKVRKVKVKTTLENMVEEVFLDISELDLGDSIRVRDIQLAEGMELLNAPGIPVASVEIPRALKSAAAEGVEGEGEGAEAEGAPAEGAPAEG